MRRQPVREDDTDDENQKRPLANRATPAIETDNSFIPNADLPNHVMGSSRPVNERTSTPAESVATPAQSRAKKTGTSTKKATSAPAKAPAGRKGTSTTAKTVATPTETQGKKTGTSTKKAPSAPVNAPASKKGTATKNAAATPSKPMTKKRSDTATTKPKVAAEETKPSKEDAKDPSVPSEREKRALRRDSRRLPVVVAKLKTEEDVEAGKPSHKRARVVSPAKKDELVQKGDKTAQPEGTST